MQRILQPQQLIPLAFDQSAHGNSCPARDDIRDFFLCHSLAQQPGLLILLRRFLRSLHLPLQIRDDAVAQLRRFVEVVDFLRIRQVLARLLQFFFSSRMP